MKYYSGSGNALVNGQNSIPAIFSSLDLAKGMLKARIWSKVAQDCSSLCCWGVGGAQLVHDSLNLAVWVVHDCGYWQSVQESLFHAQLQINIAVARSKLERRFSCDIKSEVLTSSRLT